MKPILISLLFVTLSLQAQVVAIDELPVVASVDTGKVVRIGKQQVEISEGKDGREVNIYLWDKKKRDRNKFKGHLFGVDLGFNNYVTSDHTTDLPDDMRFLDLNAGKSVGVTIHMIQESFGLNTAGNVGLVTGLGLEYHNYRFDSQYRLTKSTSGHIIYELMDRPIEKNKLTTCYLTVPLLIEVQGLRKYTGHPAYVAAGLVGGIRLSSHTKIVYADGEKVKDHGAFNLRDFRYGLMARAGYRSLNFFGVYYPSSLFKQSADPQVYPFCIGFSFLPDWM